MTGDPVSTTPDTHAKEAVDLLARHRVSSLPVVDRTGLVCGVVTEIDLLRDAVIPDVRARLRPPPGEHATPPILVADVMSSPAVTAMEAEDVADVVDLMGRLRLKSLPVVDSAQRLVGVISRSDVVRARARDDADVAEELVTLLHDLGHDEWDVEVCEGVVRISGPGSPSDRTVACVAADTVPGVVAVEVR